MTKKEIISIFVKKTIIPFAYMIVCGIILMPLLKIGDHIDLGLLFLCASYIYGISTIKRMLHIDKYSSSKTKLLGILIEIIGSLFIGIAVYAYAVIVAIYYIPITVWSLIMRNRFKSGTQTIQNENSVENVEYIEIPKEFTDSFLDEAQLQIMRDIQRVKESNTR